MHVHQIEDFTCSTRNPSTNNSCWCPFASSKKCIWICHLKMHVHQIPYTSSFDFCTLVSLVASLMMAKIVQQYTTWMDLLISKPLLQCPQSQWHSHSTFSQLRPLQYHLVNFLHLEVGGWVIYEDFTCSSRKPSTIHSCWCPFASFKNVYGFVN